jgi:hypothetical protein
MFSVRVTPWHDLGAILEHPPASVAEAIEASGIGWSVIKQPIAIHRGGTPPDWARPASEARRSPSAGCGQAALSPTLLHHRYVRGNTPRSRHLAFLVRWPSQQAVGRARQRIREITDRSRLKVPIEVIVRDLNRFVRGWAGCFRLCPAVHQDHAPRLPASGWRHRQTPQAKQAIRLPDPSPDTEPPRADHRQRNHRRAPTEPAVASRELNADGEERR